MTSPSKPLPRSQCQDYPHLHPSPEDRPLDVGRPTDSPPTPSTSLINQEFTRISTRP
uniref:Uncharacterized protein n=1 Tax=Zea mays TaxID=4577 RepID=B4FKF1_MAIZE|nr:unknown [Zea mays]